MQKAIALLSDGVFCMTIDFIRHRLHVAYPNPIERVFAVMDKLTMCEELQQPACVKSYDLYCFAGFLIDGGAEDLVMLFGIY